MLRCNDLPVEVTNVRKVGEWYTVQGVVNGRPASVDLPASSVDGRSRTDAYEYFKQSLWTIVREGF